MKQHKDKLFKDFLQNRENLAQFYYDLTGERINPDKITYYTIDTNRVREEENVTFLFDSSCVVLFDVQSSWIKEDIMRFASYLYLLFVNYVAEHEEEIFNSPNLDALPSIDAYIIYTGKKELPEEVSLDDMLSEDQDSMINATMKVTTLENAKGLVKQYIEFSQLEKEYYANEKTTKKDVTELIDYCIENNILKSYLLEHKKEVSNMIENFFTEKN